MWEKVGRSGGRWLFFPAYGDFFAVLLISLGWVAIVIRVIRCSGSDFHTVFSSSRPALKCRPLMKQGKAPIEPTTRFRPDGSPIAPLWPAEELPPFFTSPPSPPIRKGSVCGLLSAFSRESLHSFRLPDTSIAPGPWGVEATGTGRHGLRSASRKDAFSIRRGPPPYDGCEVPRHAPG